MITSFFKPKPTSGDDVEAEATGEAAATSASAALAGVKLLRRQLVARLHKQDGHAALQAILPGGLCEL